MSKLWQVLTYGERETLLRDLQQAAATLPAPDNALAADPALVLQRAGLDTDPWQTDILRARAQRVLLLCSRQAGKSTVTAAMALWEALYRSPALILLLSPSNRQSGELFRKVVELYQDVGAPVAAEHATTERLELANGSRIISLPGKERTLRGFSGVSLLVIDEAARVPDELYYGVRPMLAGSRLSIRRFGCCTSVRYWSRRSLRRRACPSCRPLASRGASDECSAQTSGRRFRARRGPGALV